MDGWMNEWKEGWMDAFISRHIWMLFGGWSSLAWAVVMCMSMKSIQIHTGNTGWTSFQPGIHSPNPAKNKGKQMSK
jgi:hypothetical protein